MRLYLKRRDSSALDIQSIVEVDLLVWDTQYSEETLTCDLPVLVVHHIEERWFANTSFHVAFVDLKPIKMKKLIKPKVHQPNSDLMTSKCS
jgi:hypothetical protein